ncbi:MAG: TonB-dependent receptor, partial [Bryobacteraceae bacterium]
NGFFHPLGDHAQTSFSIDGQPIGDQQSKQFSTQIPTNALQSMELITGAPNAEFGDKTSLVVNAVTRSGLGHSRPFGAVQLQYGSFGTISEEAAVGFGTPKFGNFLSANAIRSGRFLDTPELHPLHAVGNGQTVFDRLDFQPSARDAIHINLFGARNWFQIPNTYDQPAQDQRQKVTTWNIAPGYQHTFNASTLLTLTSFARQDNVNYYPSRNPLDDDPATVSQRRRLTNHGIRGDLSYVKGIHNVKIGVQVMQTRLEENFALGITDPDFVDAEAQPGLMPFDLTRGGRLFQFNGKTNINQQAVYVQDAITLGNLTLNAGLRFDRYDGISDANGVQPRLGISYMIKPTTTVLRAAYSRTFETPYNENLIVSSATGGGGLATNVFGAFGSDPIQPGRRDQYNLGVEQSIGKILLVDADYFWKFTDNALDFDTLFNTPILLPISWRRSKIDGVSVRISTTNLHGFQAFTTMGHTRSRFFGPEVGGLIFNSPLATSVFRIDHDQAFQQTTNLRYQRPKNGAWAGFTWRYDSGLVAGSVPDMKTALNLTGAQQAAIGLFCGGRTASPGNPITACASNFGTTRLRIPADGSADDDHNPPRVAPRNLFDISAGTDDLLKHGEGSRITLRFSVLNLTNRESLYNFLSTFSGTHFVGPRTYQAQIGFVF